MAFKKLSLVSAGLMFSLFLALLFTPMIIFTLFGVEQTTSATFFTHRVAILFLGLSLFVYSLKEVDHLKVRKPVCLSIAVMMLSLAVLGILEFVLGGSGAGIFLAIAGELILGVLYAYKYLDYDQQSRFWGG